MQFYVVYEKLIYAYIYELQRIGKEVVFVLAYVNQH